MWIPGQILFPPSFPGGPGPGFFKSPPAVGVGWLRVEAPRRCPSPTFLASFPRDPGCDVWGWGWKILNLSPREGGDLPKKPASEFPGNFSIPQQLSLEQQRGSWFLLISLYLLQKCCNCTPGAM
uniref:Uncharacterized protein n=1 Tax=Pipistrellus kuhlii TaxID=59472 RepID=A0A7J7ZJ90_PIPKU|nr:hypothetical protein mPipKuh1_009450 [Pipistrellus kuhlii]